jgi:predicted XRE-type DNA-binding protein
MEKGNKKNNPEKIEFTKGSGNVYADFGFHNPVEAKAKADLAILITGIIKDKGFTQKLAAELMGIDQPKVSKIMRGLLSEFTLERLMKFILALGLDIEIRPKKHKPSEVEPRISVVFCLPDFAPKC